MTRQTLKFRLEWPALVWPQRWFCLVCGGEPSRTRRLRYKNIREQNCPSGFLEFDAPFCAAHLVPIDRSQRLSRASYFVLIVSITSLGLIPLLTIAPWVLFAVGGFLAGVGFVFSILGKRYVLPFVARVETSGEVLLEYLEGAPRPSTSPTAHISPTRLPKTSRQELPDTLRVTDSNTDIDGGECWDELELPEILRGVAQGNDEALSAMSDKICHQGTVSSETALAVPELIKLAQNPSVRLRSDLLWLLASCANDAREESRSASAAATRRALDTVVDVIVSLLDDKDKKVRQAAAIALAAGGLLRDEARGLIRDRFNKEAESLVKAALLVALDPIRGQDMGFLNEVFRSASDPLIRFAAAALIAKGRADEIPPDVRDHLRARFNEQEEVTNLWYKLDPAGVSPLDPIEILNSVWTPE